MSSGMTTAGSNLGTVNSVTWVGMAIDVGAKKIWFRKANAWVNGDPVAGTNPSVTWAGDRTIYFAAGAYAAEDGSITVNTGQQAFVYDVPVGFTAGWI